MRPNYAGASSTVTIRIRRWEPENLIFWLTRGKPLALRNLTLSTLALHLNFNIWMMWSMVVVNLPAIGFQLTSQQQFLLVSIPPLVGALMRVLYSWVWSWVGGGLWLGLSTLLLVLPAFGVGQVVQDISAPFPLLLLVAASCGIGGGASASHLSNISFFFPKSAKGFAMGINAGFGNLGVSVAQLVVPLVIAVPLFGAWSGPPQIWGQGGSVSPVWLQNAGLVWLPLVLLVGVLCLLYAHDLPKLRITPRDQWEMMRHPHTWYICLLYMGSYGTFLGFAAAFPLLAHAMFPLQDVSPYAFIGPMLAALSRPLGGWLGDRVGGGVTTLGCNLVMALATVGVYLSLPSADEGGAFWLFLLMFEVIFLAAGIGNGSSYQLAPKVFLIEAGREAQDQGEGLAEAYRRGGRRGAAAMNVSSVMAAFGGFVIPKTFGTALEMTGSFVPAFGLFFAFYLLSVGVAWWFYARRRAEMRC
ncbi:Nitrate/nitrite transporter NarK [Gulbenkiania indica]|uniref:Nitrate/nitrite transporter NarK n=2 Tax=Gulbenkiania TaxID=397456 RepID=A0A0K6H3I2_9NEIS|nr:NNP family nitrate/nitrite transporter-like MFS transporter [Gulbenkiania mobilis]CUA85289.1 Nitrate/nitrite transporter NarK [Gulbenkiania indica]